MADEPAALLAQHRWDYELHESQTDSGKHRGSRAVRGQPAETVARMLRVLAMLPRPPQKITARTIFAALRDEGHGVTTRTVERDLHRLRLVIPLVLDDRRKPYGWSWDRRVGPDLVK